MKTILTTKDWTHLQEIFNRAASLDEPERSAWLDSAFTGEPYLRAQLDRLLASIEEGTGISNAVQVAHADFASSIALAPGDMLGSYRVIEPIGRGGMGIVYRCQREGDFQKEVAIKVAATGLLSSELQQRFVVERQILAKLEHPNIARLHDGGTTDAGVPYVVMEYVSGQPLDRYCEERSLDRRQRVQLMVEVARAVDYAHRHLVVHRDLKPENILVTADGTPKLLDFGIAKALGPQPGLDLSKTVDTTRLMTPEYASPEQVRGEPVTTATDVYQIGVLLYRLLTGRPLFDIGKGRMSDLERAICENVPAQPRLERDLDYVLLHALEKDQQRRYPSAGDLADDLQRWLNGMPIEAHPASWTYRTSKFIRRHKLAAGGAAVIVMLMIGFTLALAIQIKRVRHERDVAAQVAAFLTTVFSASNPAMARGHVVTARELLDSGALKIEQQRFPDPRVKEELLVTLAQSYESLGDYNRAVSLFQQSLNLDERIYGSQSNQVAAALGRLAAADVLAENYTGMAAILPRWKALTISLTGPDSVASSYALSMEAGEDFLAGRLFAAEDLQQHVLRIDEKAYGQASPEAVGAYGFLGYIQEYRGEDALAAASYRKALAYVQRGDWEASPAVTEILDLQSKLGYVLTEEGQYAQAEPMLLEALALRRKILGPRHNLFANSEICMGYLDAALGRFRQADELIRDAISIHTAVLGANSEYVGGDSDELARAYIFQGKFAQAMPYLQTALANMTQRTGLHGPGEHGESPYMARVLCHLAEAQLGQKHPELAVQTANRALAIEVRMNGDASPYAADDYRTLGEAQAAAGDYAAAEQNLRHALRIFSTTASVYRPGRARTLLALGSLLEKEGHRQQGMALRAEGRALRTSLMPASLKG